MLPKDKISQLVLCYKGKELPGFISFTTFTKIYMETLLRWNDITKAHVFNMHTQFNPSGEQIKATLRQHLQSFSNVARISDVNYNEQLAVEDLQEQLTSYCKVARKRIVDVLLLQTIGRHLIKSVHIYFDMLIAVDDNTITSRLIESPAKQARRKELDHKVDVLRKSLLEL